MKRTVILTLLTLSLSLELPNIALAEDTPPSTQPQESVETVPAESTPPKKPAFSLNVDTEALKLTDDVATAEAQVAEHPDDPEAHFLLAAAYGRSPRLDLAFREMKKVKELLKVNKDFEFIDRTIAQYEDLQKGHPDDTVVLFRLAMGYFFKGYSIEKYPHHFKNGPTGTAPEYYQKAITTMQHVIDLNPKDTWARNYMGYLVTDNGKDLSKGIPIWKESLAIDPKNNAGAYLLLSQAYLKQGDIANALIHGAKGLEIQQGMGMLLP